MPWLKNGRNWTLSHLTTIDLHNLTTWMSHAIYANEASIMTTKSSSLTPLLFKYTSSNAYNQTWDPNLKDAFCNTPTIFLQPSSISNSSNFGICSKHPIHHRHHQGTWNATKIVNPYITRPKKRIIKSQRTVYIVLRLINNAIHKATHYKILRCNIPATTHHVGHSKSTEAIE